MSAGPAPALAGSLCFVLGVALAVVAGSARQQANDELLARRFDALARQVTGSVTARMHSFEYGLRGMRGVVVAQAGLPSPEQVRRYGASRDIAKEFPGARAFGLIWRVPEDETAAFVARMRAAGRPGFTLRQLAPHAGERFIIAHVEPQAPNSTAVGLDIASEGRRRSAALAAQASGSTAITEPITLVQETGRRLRSFLMLLPITHRSFQPGTANPDVAGWSYAPIVIDDVLATLELPEDMVWLELRDAGSASDATFYVSEGAEPTADALPATVIRFPMFNREWVARVRARPALAEELRLTSPALVVAVGTLLAALAGGVSFLLAQRQRRARSLRLERAQRAAIVEASDDGIVGVRLDGTITEWNGGAERLFGFAAGEVLDRPIKDVLPAPAWLDEDAAVFASVGAGTRVAPFETQRRHRDGSVVEVSVSAAPIHGPGGNLAGLAMTFRDMRAAKAARLALEALNASLDRQVRERTAALDRTLHDLRNIVDALPSMIGYWDRDLRNRMANRAYAGWFGMEPEQLKGRSMAELLSGERYELNRPLFEAALRGESRTVHRSLPRPDGGTPFHGLVHFLPDVTGGVVRGFYVLVHDVTELQLQRAALEAEKREKAGLLATIDAHAIVSTTDRSGIILSVNERFCQVSGHPAAALVGRTHRIVNAGVHPPQFWQAVWRTLAAGDSWQGEICNRARDGSLYWIDSIIAPFLDERGRIEKIIAFSTDITARKAAELASRQALATLESVLESATQIAIVATDLAGTVTLFNGGAARMLGHAAAEVVGHAGAMRWYRREDLAAHAADLGARLGRSIAPEAVLTDGAAAGLPFDCHYVRADGSLVPVTVSVAPILDADGTLLGHIHVAYDIRYRLAQEALLKEAAAAAERANEAKSRFLANMSHEIRTPLNAVLGLAWLLERTALDGEQAVHVANIRAAGSALLAIVNDVLDLSKIEAGEMPIEHVAFSLRDVCSDLQALFGAQARARHLALRLVPDEALPDALVGDPTRLRQVLVNLLANALKFTERGSVELAIRRLEAPADACRLCFTVRDTGIGIAPEALERLFQPFAQADASTTRRFGGTGLGLSIVRNLVQMMGGRLVADSTPGHGSSFEVELTFGLGDPAALGERIARGTEGQRLPGVRVLLVDDSEINLTVAGRLLEIEGALVTLARNGAEAVDIAAARGDLQLVLMDIQMPVMDGLDAARAILRQAGTAPAGSCVPVLVALTAGNTISERQRAREAGFVDIFSKPIDPERLVQDIRRLLALAPAPAAAPAAPTQDGDWPVIEGIDAVQARRRFMGDTGMFGNMLARLFELCDDATGLGARMPRDPAALARLMHTLKGNAATLGASGLAEAAARVETACLQGLDEALGPALADLERLAHRLDEAATGFAARAAPAWPRAAAVPPDRARLAELLDALRSHDLGALDLFQQLAPGLHALLGAAAMARLADEVHGLRFSEAAATLQTAYADGALD
ncbi:PAS domain S-box protein [uncultured Massilia sp.]|uniref:PAS domain S-box protein n=1 Tax=uncultured Massilia sp. TaxID=169973 RepID=UPI0025F3DF2A|nr:PAS domain S-box protein [uncultured Massilia sp.]